ncbi:hypothetical protein BC936DRAFT_140253 [Jimgerdemannia flammicorona]|uniref:Uncharacterized protein n=1 Tax=Jimgerdemannia flammicorona TaxID=994334 RepID=A0A433DH44_9FUNG|nr:hypothetical protein BC936DRAFT_140253 [Jimgerdemannia flammicorona]
MFPTTAIHLFSLVLEEHDVTFILHELALRVTPPQRDWDGRVVVDVRLAQNFLDVARRLLRVVMRHLREEVMRHVGVGDVVMKVVQQPAVRPINRQSCAALEVPDRLTVVRQGWVGVLQKGDEDQPEVDHHVRNNVILRDGQGTKDDGAVGKG